MINRHRQRPDGAVAVAESGRGDRLRGVGSRHRHSTLKRAFHVEAVPTTHGIQSGEKPAREVIIRSRTFPGVATEKAV